MHSYYKELNEARQYWAAARRWLGLGIHMSGALGVRTKFQTVQIAQLLLRATHGHTPIEVAPKGSFPAAVELGDVGPAHQLFVFLSRFKPASADDCCGGGPWRYSRAWPVAHAAVRLL